MPITTNANPKKTKNGPAVYGEIATNIVPNKIMKAKMG
jgi:hypothetical protein